MNIGEPFRTIVVEPLELPLNNPDTEQEPKHTPMEPEPEQEPAAV